jgi:Fic family protein
LGELDAVSDLLPNVALLHYGFVRKEAVLSSMIEGTQSSLADLMLFELDEQPGVPMEDAREVSRYVAALEHGLEQVRGGFLLSLRLIREVHQELMTRGGSEGRGPRLTPGEFRSSQVWIGGTRPGNAVFVPPPANELDECLKLFERFLHDVPEPTSPLVKAALAHVQFETIHPFLDGNGRVGRLLIALQLAVDGLMREPMLVLSLHFKEHRQTYYDLLNAVRLSGDWESPGWGSSPMPWWPAPRSPLRRPSACWNWPRRTASALRASAAPQDRQRRFTRPCGASPSPLPRRWLPPPASRRPQ